MSIRVHQLAKEFKISTAALKKHLGDMGVVVKSHMSPVDDEIVVKIRAKFNEEVQAVKRRQHDRKSIHKKIVLADKKRVEETKQTKPAQTDKTASQEIPVFVEKKIKKSATRTESRDKTSSYKKQVKDTSSEPKPIYKKSVLEPKPIVETKFRDKPKDKDKKTFEEKNKHLEAKKKSFKKGNRKKKFIPTEIEEAEISKNIRKTLSGGAKKKKGKLSKKAKKPSKKPSKKSKSKKHSKKSKSKKSKSKKSKK